MSFLDDLRSWCEENKASFEQQLEMLEAGVMHTWEDRGHGAIDTTDRTKAWVREQLASLVQLLSEYPPEQEK